MAGLLPGRTKATLTGTTPVTLVASPASGWTRTVLSCRWNNPDTVGHDFILQHNDGGGATEVDRQDGTVPEGTWIPISRDNPIILKPTDTLLGVIDATHTTTAPVVITSWIDQEDIP